MIFSCILGTLHLFKLPRQKKSVYLDPLEVSKKLKLYQCVAEDNEKKEGGDEECAYIFSKEIYIIMRNRQSKHTHGDLSLKQT